MFCNFCNGELDKKYVVPTSKRDAVVYVCKDCGLIQSKMISIDIKHSPSNSSGATWGNIRHVKELRAKDNLKFLESVIDIQSINSVLDIGSSRGTLLKLLSNTVPNAILCGIEPDELLPEINIPNCNIIKDKVENLSLDIYDLIYLSHTLEHVDDIHSVMKAIKKCCHNNTIIFLEVPNTQIITTKDCYNEFFIDKHNFHFTSTTITNIFTEYGLEVVADKSNNYNLTYILKSCKNTYEIVNSYSYNLSLIETYLHNKAKIDIDLSKVANFINKISNKQKIVIWGANHILDAVVQKGLILDNIFAIVDDHIYKYMPLYQNSNINSSNVLKERLPDIIVVFAGMSSDKIVDKARKYLRNVITIKEIVDTQ